MSDWQPSWIYDKSKIDTDGWTAAQWKGRTYYYNSKTKKSVWIKPDELQALERKWKEWEAELAKDPIW